MFYISQKIETFWRDAKIIRYEFYVSAQFDHYNISLCVFQAQRREIKSISIKSSEAEPHSSLTMKPTLFDEKWLKNSLVSVYGIYVSEPCYSETSIVLLGPSAIATTARLPNHLCTCGTTCAFSCIARLLLLIYTGNKKYQDGRKESF